MTNAMIILMESVKLMEEGKLNGTGEFIEIETENGTKKLELPEPIHTYNKWKDLGYQVRKGEKSEIKFTIWKYSEKKNIDEESGEETESGKCFMKTSAFFRLDQVDKIA